jgi:hypothetical protein
LLEEGEAYMDDYTAQSKFRKTSPQLGPTDDLIRHVAASLRSSPEATNAALAAVQPGPSGASEWSAAEIALGLVAVTALGGLIAAWVRKELMNRRN